MEVIQNPLEVIQNREQKHAVELTNPRTSVEVRESVEARERVQRLEKGCKAPRIARVSIIRNIFVCVCVCVLWVCVCVCVRVCTERERERERERGGRSRHLA